MKRLTKIATSVMLGIASFTTSFSQTTSIGPMAGVNIAKFQDAPDSKYTVGASAGGFLNHSFNENFGMTAKLLFSQMGNKNEVFKATAKLNYVQVPITGVYYFGKQGQAFRPKIFAGLYAAGLASAKNKYYESNTSETVTGAYNSFDGGGTLGLGFNYLLSDKSWLNFDLGYNQGFTDITKNSTIDYKNQGFNVNVGVSFPVGKK